jgi:hypothetical protein
MQKDRSLCGHPERSDGSGQLFFVFNTLRRTAEIPRCARKSVILSEAKNLHLFASELQILRFHENDSPPQREEGQGVVGGTVSERQPPLTPP